MCCSLQRAEAQVDRLRHQRDALKAALEEQQALHAALRKGTDPQLLQVGRRWECVGWGRAALGRGRVSGMAADLAGPDSMPHSGCPGLIASYCRWGGEWEYAGTGISDM